MAQGLKRYAATIASLIGAMVAVFFVGLLFDGVIRIIAIVLLVTVVGALAATIGAEARRQRDAST